MEEEKGPQIRENQGLTSNEENVDNVDNFVEMAGENRSIILKCRKMEQCKEYEKPNRLATKNPHSRIDQSTKLCG